MQIIRIINMTIAFALEMFMLFALAYSGYHLGKTNFSKYGLAILLPGFAIALWGYFAAPKSTTQLEKPFLYVFQLCMFAVSAYLYCKSGQTSQALVFIIIATLNVLLAFMLKQ